MNNPGIDTVIWEQLRSKWDQLDKSGQEMKVEFKVIKASENAGKPLAIDVIQTINNEMRVETVQHSVGEAYPALGITGFSMEDLVQTYKKILHDLYRRVKKEDTDLIVVMTPHSETSGETIGYLQQPGTEMKRYVLLNYQHYYMLNALRERMIDQLGEHWSQVKAIYHSGDVEFHFEYSES